MENLHTQQPQRNRPRTDRARAADRAAQQYERAELRQLAQERAAQLWERSRQAEAARMSRDVAELLELAQERSRIHRHQRAPRPTPRRRPRRATTTGTDPPDDDGDPQPRRFPDRAGMVCPLAFPSLPSRRRSTLPARPHPRRGDSSPAPRPGTKKPRPCSLETDKERSL